MLALVAGLLVRSVRGRDRLAREVALEKQRSRSLESMGHLAAGLAHETRNPLGAIRGYAQLLHEQSGDEEARERTAVIIRELDRVGEKLEEFLGFARKRNLEKELTDLATVARETVMLVQPDADARGVDLDVSASPSVSPIDADPRQLKELMLNLVLNAVQACDEGGSVQVRVDGGHGGPVVRVVDSGAGIAVDDAPRIFEPYFTTREDGSGMGLAISRRIAEDHGALLTVQGSPGGGAEARLEFGRGDKGGA
jgi:signal transduction histidine kinase